MLNDPDLLVERQMLVLKLGVGGLNSLNMLDGSCQVSISFLLLYYLYETVLIQEWYLFGMEMLL